MSKKNKVILFYGKQTDSQINDWIPYNMLYLTAPLRPAGFEPVLITEFTTPEYEDIIREHAEDSLAFGVSSFTSRQISSGLHAAEIYRKYAPDKPIIWGGHHPKALPEQTLENDLVDMVFTGWGEIALPRVLSALREKGDLRGIPGLMYKNNGEKIFSGKPERFDLSKLPPFTFDVIQIEKYMNPNTRVLNYTASCGCPGCCSFCPWNGPHSWSPLPLKRILGDLEMLINRYHPQTIWLSDANFFVNKEFVLGFARGLRERGLNVYWYAFGRISDLIKFSTEEMSELQESGLVEIFVGIEQTTERMKKLLRKTFRLEYVDAILKRLKNLDIALRLSFICGLPTETIEDLESNYYNSERWHSINKNVNIQASQYKPYPGNSAYELAIKEGMKPPKRLEDWATFPLLYTNYRRSSGKEANTWVDVPWFSEDFNGKYGGKFLELFPCQEGITFKEACPV